MLVMVIRLEVGAYDLLVFHGTGHHRYRHLCHLAAPKPRMV